MLTLLEGYFSCLRLIKYLYLFKSFEKIYNSPSSYNKMHKKTDMKKRRKKLNFKRPGAGENTGPSPEDVWKAERKY